MKNKNKSLKKKDRSQGSVLFGTNVVRTDDYVMMAKVITENGGTPEQAALEIEFFDDMLSVQRMRMITVTRSFTPTGRKRKDADFQGILNTRLDVLMNDLNKLKQ